MKFKKSQCAGGLNLCGAQRANLAYWASITEICRTELYNKAI